MKQIEYQLIGLSDDQIDEISKRASGNITEAVKMAIQQNDISVKVNQILSRDQKFLSVKVAEFTDETSKDITAGKLKYRDADFYLNKEIGSGNIVDLLLESDTKVAGIKNFDKNYLPARTNMALRGVRLGYFWSATQISPKLAKFTNAMDAEIPGGGGSVPAELLNGEFTIMQDDKILCYLPVCKFFRDTLSYSNEAQGGKDTVQLESMAFIREISPITMQIRLPEGVSLPEGFHYLQVRMMGTITVVR